MSVILSEKDLRPNSRRHKRSRPPTRQNWPKYPRSCNAAAVPRRVRQRSRPVCLRQSAGPPARSEHALHLSRRRAARGRDAAGRHGAGWAARDDDRANSRCGSRRCRQARHRVAAPRFADDQPGGLTGEAREVIILLYENPEIVWLGFKDPSFPLPKVIESLFPHRIALLGIGRDRLRRLITPARKPQIRQAFNPWGLYKYVSGLNAVRLRKLLSTLEGEDYPADPKLAYRQLRQATLTVLSKFRRFHSTAISADMQGEETAASGTARYPGPARCDDR